jgi:hypothetical protein
MARYFDREGRRIDAAAWAELQKKPEYVLLKEYDNGAVRVRLVWIGKISEKEHSSFRDTWPLFSMGVWNYTDTGALVPDPVSNGETFANESDALTAYEDFLITWTDSQMGEKGLIEVDNNLAPPPPPNPDLPATEFRLDEDNDAAW